MKIPCSGAQGSMEQNRTSKSQTSDRTELGQKNENLGPIILPTRLAVRGPLTGLGDVFGENNNF